VKTGAGFLRTPVKSAALLTVMNFTGQVEGIGQYHWLNMNNIYFFTMKLLKDMKGKIGYFSVFLLHVFPVLMVIHIAVAKVNDIDYLATTQSQKKLIDKCVNTHYIKFIKIGTTS
jgi:hypothetical protein